VATSISSSPLMLKRAAYCNRTATGLVQASTQWTNSFARSAENRLNKHNSRTYQYGLARVQANS
jgi:hypothetical protein